MLSPTQETQHQKQAAVTLAPGRHPQPRGPVHLAHGPGFLRHAPGCPVHGAGVQRPGPLRLALDPEFPPHRAERVVQDPEFQPLDPERQRQERRYAM